MARGAASLGRLPRRVRRPAPVRPVVPRPLPCAAAARGLRVRGGRRARRLVRAAARRGGRLHRRRNVARDAAHERPRPPPRRADPRRRALPPGRASRAPAAVDRARRAPRRRARRRRARGRDPAGGRQERVPALADVEADLPSAGPGRRPLRLGLELRRLHVAAQDDDRVQGAGVAAVALLALDHARPLHGRALGRVPAAGTRRALRRPARPDAERPARPARRARPGDVEEGAVRDRRRSPTTTSSRRASPSATSRSFSGADFFQGGSGALAGRARARPALRRVELLAASDVRAARGDRRRLRPGRAAVPRGLSRASRRRRSGRPTARRRCAASSPTYPDYKPLYSQARRVVGNAQSPYAAVLALESWLRSTGGFVYTQHPPLAARRAAPRLRRSARSAATASTSRARWR